MQRVMIRVQGHLDAHWSEWLDGFTLAHTKQGVTVLTGFVRDQAALYGLMAKLRDLGVDLLAADIRDARDASFGEDHGGVPAQPGPRDPR